MAFYFNLGHGLTALFLLVGATAHAQLPATVEEALMRARIPASAAALLVVDAQDAKAVPRLQHGLSRWLLLWTVPLRCHS